MGVELNEGDVTWVRLHWVQLGEVSAVMEPLKFRKNQQFNFK